VLVLAHAAHGNALGVPEWLLVALLLLGTTLSWTALRTSWPTARLAAAATRGRVLPAWTAPTRRVLVAVLATAGLVVWALTLSAGLFAVDDAPENLAPFVLNLQLVGGGMLLAAVAGDWWRAAGPFALLARLLPDRREAPNAAPAWTAPVMLASFLWLVGCYHAGGEPRSGGIWLLLYTIATLAGAVAWGRWWVETGEGFAVLFGSMARLSPFHRDVATGRIALRAPLSGLGADDLPAGAAPTLLLVAGAATFGAIRRLDWWQLDVVGTRSGWDRTLVDTIGLAFVVGVAAIVWLAATRIRPSAPPLVPLVLGIATAFLLTDFISRSVDVVALLSDPYGRDWDLLGTADWFPDIRWQVSTRLAWTELAALLVGAVLSVVVAHDRTLATEKGRASAERALLPKLAAGTLLATASLLILLR
jgi:hypothetical protein